MPAPTAPSAPDALFVAFQQAIAGRYSLDRELGRGGNGVVYLAREVHLDRLVAIKLLPPERAHDDATREHFLREARVAASLSHPHIVPIHAVDHIGAFVFFVMAFIDGETVAQRVQARGPVPAREATRWLREVAWALSYAHGRGVVHRDIKPDNILVERESGRALVADFGIAHLGHDASEQVTGTPEFMAPELALDGAPSAASDIYALGITAWYALTGRVPFHGVTATQVLAQHCTKPLPPLHAPGLTIPRRLAQLIEHCLAKEPSARPASADVVAEHLAPSLEQRRELPVALRAFVRRNGRLDGGGTVLTLLGALGAGVGIAALAGPVAGVAAMLGTVVVAPVAFAVVAARKLMMHGYAHADLDAAFATELETVREEAGVEPARVSRVLERITRAMARIGVRTTVAVAPFALAGVFLPRFAPVSSLLAACAVGTSIATIAWLGVMHGRRDVDVRFWRAAWTGHRGRAVFALARKLRGAAPSAPVVTHRATELSLSLAAEQLFETLPRDTRAALGDVPAIVHRLQENAKRLRTQLAQLNETVSGANASTQSDDALRSERAQVHARLQDTVVSLETMRLGLLRLHAGTVSVEGLTADLGLASELSADVSRLATAQREVDALLLPGREIGHDIALSPA